MITLNDDLTLGIEKQDKRIRLIIYQNSVELICRKSSFTEVKKMDQASEAHLFKGRLQLYRLGDDIAVEVKGKQAGMIKLAAFKELLNQ